MARSASGAFSIVFALTIFASAVAGQIDEFCAEAGHMPSLESPFLHVPYVYGRVAVSGIDPNAKLPKVAVLYSDSQQPAKRFVLSRSGNYCFRRMGSGGTLVVEVDGLEVARRSLPSMGAAQQREDFEIVAGKAGTQASPGIVSTRFTRPPNEKTIELYKKAAEAERAKDLENAINHVNQIVSLDPDDFIAWAKLGSLQFERASFTEADAAYRRSLEIRVDYTPAWINVGKLRMAQKQYETAAEIFKHAALLEPTSAPIFRLLGEAYLLAKKGSLGVQALDEAIRLDPIGMAECHLQKAHLYELVGAKQLATKEYKAFLKKVPDHPNRKRIEKFIKDNPE